MGKMKELITNKANEIALERYDKEFYELSAEQQDEVWKLAEQAGQDWLADQIDKARDEVKLAETGAIKRALWKKTE